MLKNEYLLYKIDIFFHSRIQIYKPAYLGIYLSIYLSCNWKKT